MYPTPTYYSTKPTTFANALHQGLKRVLGGEQRPFAIRIMPDLVKGDSVGVARG
jgi:hypothetical protein